MTFPPRFEVENFDFKAPPFFLGEIQKISVREFIRVVFYGFVHTLGVNSINSAHIAIEQNLLPAQFDDGFFYRMNTDWVVHLLWDLRREKKDRGLKAWPFELRSIRCSRIESLAVPAEPESLLQDGE